MQIKEKKTHGFPVTALLVIFDQWNQCKNFLWGAAQNVLQNVDLIFHKTNIVETTPSWVLTFNAFCNGAGMTSS